MLVTVDLTRGCGIGSRIHTAAGQLALAGQSRRIPRSGPPDPASAQERASMPRDPDSPRFPGASSEPGFTATAAATPASLLSRVARPTRLGELLPHLHQYALDVTGGARSLLFEYNPRNGLMQATSGFGLDALPSESWTPTTGESS